MRLVTSNTIKAMLCGVALSLAVTPAMAKSFRGYFVVAGSYRLEDQEGANSLRSIAKNCRVQLYERDTDDMAGMAKGRKVQLSGPYATKDRADKVLRTLRPCLEDAKIVRSIDRFSESEY